MNRTVFGLVAALVWLMAIFATWVSWPRLVRTCESFSPEQASTIAGAAVFLSALFGVLMTALVADRVTPKTAGAARKKSEAEVRAQKEKEAEAALKDGRPKLAISILEGAGLFMKAIEIARNTEDTAALARLSLRLGKHQKARQYFLELEDYEAAANISLLLGEIPKARELYSEAARKASLGQATPQLAALWERAGDRARAAELYEELGDLRRASECLLILGDTMKAEKCLERAEVIEAYERRKTGTEIDVSRRSADAMMTAELMLSLGDLFGGADAYREAGDYIKAAGLFEKIEEWERAARAFEKAGRQDKAAEMRAIRDAREPVRARVAPPPSAPTQTMTAPPPPGPAQIIHGAPPPDPTAYVPPTAYQPPPASAGQVPMIAAPPAMPPAPMTLPPANFMNVGLRPQYIPVYVTVPAAAPAISPDQLARLISSGQFAQAAETAIAAGRWDQAAQIQEQGGNWQQAAAIHQQIGQVAQAQTCLQRAGRPVEAAMIAYAMGKRARAARILTQEIDKQREPDLNIGLQLGQLLIEHGKYYRALELLCNKLGKGGVNESNASLYYQFARLFERAGAVREALALYEEILASGAVSEDLTARVEKLRQQAKLASDSEGPRLEFRSQDAAPKLVEPTRKHGATQRSAADFLRSALDESSGAMPAIPAEAKAEAAAKAKPYPFAPPHLPTPFMAEKAGSPQAAAIVEDALPHRELSLFGLPPAAAEEEEMETSAPTPVAASLRGADPFAPVQRYKIHRELARGGMGIIYEAEDLALSRPVALKVLTTMEAGSDDINQFLLEARAVARINHQNIVAVYDVGLMNLRHYIAMEMVRGIDLGKHIKNKGKLPLKDALRFFIEIARGLKTAHEAGIVHRDIKPANVLLNDKGTVKIVDFGLAKLCTEEVEDEQHHTIFKTAGTPGYMAPEQIRGEELLPACDVYALGITLFTMLAGQPPHRAAGMARRWDIIDLQLSGRLPKIGEFVQGIPAAIEQVYDYCTRVKREERYQSMDAFLPIMEQWQQVL